MNEPSRRWRREQLKQQQQARRDAARKLRAGLAAAGRTPQPAATIANGIHEYCGVAEEKAARQQAVEEQLKVYRAQLPILLQRLAKIKDPRNPKTIKHKSAVLMLYGILAFVFQMSSRREANRQMSLPMFQENLRLMFPELESLPHQDTLNRLLAGIEVDEIEETLIALIQRLIRGKKFYRYLVANRYPIAIDGTQKLVRDYCWAEQCLERQVPCKEPDGTPATRPQYYVYVLEAKLAFAGGMTIPLMSEFLSYTEGDQATNKQDCELKAFKRLALRIKQHFPRLPILLLLDGLYANGPVMQLCRSYHWQFMIVLQNDSLPSVWEEAAGLAKIQPHNRLQRTWGDRRQHFQWINGIQYFYGDQGRRSQTLHMAVCWETWQEVDANTAAIAAKSSRFVWISSEPLSRENIHERCNLGARHRWGIENNFLVEKRQGYQYEHCFSHSWNAMRGYHFLMCLAHLMNTLALHTARLARLVARRGVRGTIQFVRETISGPWLDAARIQAVRAAPLQLRLQ